VHAGFKTWEQKLFSKKILNDSKLLSERNLIGKMFMKLLKNFKNKKTQNDLEFKSGLFHNQNLISKTFIKMKSQSKTKEIFKTRDYVADSFHAQTILDQKFSKWLKYSQKHFLLTKLLTKKLKIKTKNQKKTMIIFWAKKLNHQRWLNLNLLKSLEFHKIQVLKSSLKKWKSLKDFKCLFFQKYTLPIVVYLKNLLKRKFINWKIELDQKRVYNQMVDESIGFRKKICQGIVEDLYFKWRDRFNIKVVLQNRSKRAEEFRREMLLKSFMQKAKNVPQFNGLDGIDEFVGRSDPRIGFRSKKMEPIVLDFVYDNQIGRFKKVNSDPFPKPGLEKHDTVGSNINIETKGFEHGQRYASFYLGDSESCDEPEYMDRNYYASTYDKLHAELINDYDTEISEHELFSTSLLYTGIHAETNNTEIDSSGPSSESDYNKQNHSNQLKYDIQDSIETPSFNYSMISLDEEDKTKKIKEINEKLQYFNKKTRLFYENSEVLKLIQEKMKSGKGLEELLRDHLVYSRVVQEDQILKVALRKEIEDLRQEIKELLA
jgi:hypothetical protein